MPQWKGNPYNQIQERWTKTLGLPVLSLHTYFQAWQSTRLRIWEAGRYEHFRTSSLISKLIKKFNQSKFWKKSRYHRSPAPALSSPNLLCTVIWRRGMSRTWLTSSWKTLLKQFLRYWLCITFWKCNRSFLPSSPLLKVKFRIDIIHKNAVPLLVYYAHYFHAMRGWIYILARTWLVGL